MLPPIPRSFVLGTIWPAVVDGPAADMLGLQFQFLQAERLPAEELRARQFSQLDALVDYCARTMPFHRDKLAAAGHRQNTPLSADVFARLPVLTLAEVIQAGSRMHGLSVPSAHGGTVRGTVLAAGKPLALLATGLHARFNDAYLLRDLLWHETDFRGKWARIAHDPATVRAGARGARERDWGPSVATAFVTGTAVGLDTERLVTEQATWLARERPTYLSAPPETLRALAGHLRQHKQKPPPLSGLRCDGIAPPDLAPLCQEVFGRPPIMSAILPEIGCLALQCPEHGGLHAMAEGVFTEILDAAGTPCPPGQPGRLVVTPLHNFAMPLLRYDTGLQAALGQPCPCGRTLPVLENLSWRPAGSA